MSRGEMDRMELPPGAPDELSDAISVLGTTLDDIKDHLAVGDVPRPEVVRLVNAAEVALNLLHDWALSELRDE